MLDEWAGFTMILSQQQSRGESPYLQVVRQQQVHSYLRILVKGDDPAGERHPPQLLRLTATAQFTGQSLCHGIFCWR